MTSPYLENHTRSREQAIGDCKRTQLSRVLADIPQTYFILLDRGAAGHHFKHTKMGGSRTEMVTLIRGLDVNNSSAILGIFCTCSGKFKNVTSEIINEARRVH